MKRTLMLGLAGSVLLAGPALAQPYFGGGSYFGDDGPGWGPAYRPESSFVEPGFPPTPGQIAGEAYRQRTGRPVYPRFGPDVTGSVGEVYEVVPPRVQRQRALRKQPSMKRREVRRRHKMY